MKHPTILIASPTKFITVTSIGDTILLNTGKGSADIQLNPEMAQLLGDALKGAARGAKNAQPSERGGQHTITDTRETN